MHDHNHHHSHNHDSETAKTDYEKLKMLMKYWLSHNKEHINDHEKWLKKTEEMGLNDVASELKEIISLLKEVNKHISLAYKKMEGR
ncbi:MAG: hypothetical protein SVZ03_16165 [Spirochaetota bacterium]|nr:hypothetical protein [Spirochaetota bacterium]